MIAYFDCFSGISGDMMLGALVDAGVSPLKLKCELARFPHRGYELKKGSVKRAGFRATKVDVVLKTGFRGKGSEMRGQGAVGRKWSDIERLIKSSDLSHSIKKQGLSIFEKLFKAEARVHGGRYDTVHLHELGAVDCIVDILGVLIGLDILGVKSVYSSPLNLGSGSVKTEHGMLPVPAPATVELLKNIPVYSSDIKRELTTPTGAVLISSLSSGFGPIPEMNVSKTGIGAGAANFRQQPNVLRMFVGNGSGDITNTNDGVVVIETNIDDMNPQVYEYVMDKLFKKGALDVFLTQVIMKKGRPGITLTALCHDNKKNALIDIILRETTSIGVRFYRAERKVLSRDVRRVKTGYGTVNVKISRLNKDKSRTSVEYEDCKKIAKKFDIPLLEVMNTISCKKQ
jgi:uncharacterized protein (TIGR00299 family) protein